MFHTVERLKGERLGALARPTVAGEHRAECEGQIAAMADCVTVASEHERDQLRRLYGLSGARLEVIPCGVDLRAFTAGTAERRRAARAALGLPPDAPVLLSVCRLDPIKGTDLLLDSAAAMRTPATLVLVGGDPEGDPELERLRLRARELGLGERLRLPGAEGQERLPLYYHAADALVVASRYESFGLVAVEALACGTPVVAAHVGGLPSIIRDGENGLLIPWRRPEVFAQALDALLEDAPRLAGLRAAARPSVLRFDWRRIGDQVRGVYQSLSAERRAALACCCM
jgi:D-inositol-3-phosphate glycosyltransferase